MPRRSNGGNQRGSLLRPTRPAPLIRGSVLPSCRASRIYRHMSALPSAAGVTPAAAHASYADIVKITTYVVNYKAEDRAVIGKARAPFFASGMLPASTLVGVTALALPEWLVEIEAVAVIGASGCPLPART